MVELPEVLVIGGVVVAVPALLPRWASTVSWTFVLVSLLLGPMFGAATLQLRQRTQNLSPFTHIPKAPEPTITIVPIASLLTIAAILAVAACRIPPPQPPLPA